MNTKTTIMCSVMILSFLFIANSPSAETETGQVTREAVSALEQGRDHHNRDDYRQAIQDYNKAIEINPKHVEPYNNRGVIYGKLGNKNKEIEDYGKAADLNQQNKAGKP